MRINLLPPEVFERQRARRRTVAVSALGFIVLAALGAFYVLQISRLSDVEDDITAQQATNAELQAQVADLQDVAQLEQEIAATRTLLDGLLADRVQWSGVLGDVSLVIPAQAWLNGLTGTTAAAAPEGEAVTTGAFAGQIQFTGFAFEHRDVALWLSRLEDVRGFLNPWLGTSTKTEIGDRQVVEFQSSVDLSTEALESEQGGQP
ncbi:MAG: PilN domain-containing protein [Actinomycetota bacterium]